MAEQVRVFAVLDGERVEVDAPKAALSMYLPNGWRLVGGEDDPQAKSQQVPSPTPRSGKNEGPN